MPDVSRQLSTTTLSRLIQDNDGNWYVIPVDREDAFVDWVKCKERGIPMVTDLEPQLVNGPHTVGFLYWEEEYGMDETC